MLLIFWTKTANLWNILVVFLTVHNELTIYWLPTWCTDYYLL